MITYIINVSDHSSRRERMIKVIEANGCLAKNHLFIHEGDMKDLSEAVLDKYFLGELKQIKPATSCAYKHILAYEKLVFSKDDLALILEDDVVLSKSFCKYFDKIKLEISHRKLENFLISLEDSNLNFVKGSERKKDQMLYKKTYGRMASAYIIDKTFAQNVLNEILNNKCHLPIDWFQNHCSEQNLINIYWSHPTIASQGSVMGTIPSIIDQSKTGLMRQITYGLTKFYKKTINNFR